MSLFKRPTNGPRIRQMAQAVGLDLDQTQKAGGVAAYEVRAAERLCGECRGSRECEIWLATHKDTGADAAPSYCPNRGLYRELKLSKDESL